jgi:transposase
MNYITKPNQKTRIMNIIEEIKIMTRNNESIKIKTIAKRFGVSKNTVKRYIKLISEGKEETNVKTRETTQEKELNKHKE